MLKKYRSLSPETKHRLNLAILFVISLFVFAILIKLVVRLVGSDDTVFKTQIQPYADVFQWVNARYHLWSGRIFAEGFVYIFTTLPLFAWKIASVVIYGLYLFTMFKYYRLFVRYSKKDSLNDYVALAVSAALPYLMQTNVLYDGALWVTGAMNYAWMAAFALIAFYPVAHIASQRSLPSKPILLLSAISCIIAASSSEQLGATLLVLSLLFTGYIYYTQRVSKQLIVSSTYAALATLSFTFGILAPGNKLRIVQETAHWLPDFYSTSIAAHINYAYRWFLEGFINHTGLLLVGIGLFLALFIFKKNRTILGRMVAIILSIGSIVIALKGHDAVNFWVSFYATWKSPLPSLAAILPLIGWFIFIIALAVAPFYALNRRRGYIISLLLCASLATTLMITLSPTMYASGWRTLYMPSFILLFALFMIIVEFLRKFPQRRRVLLAFVILLGLFQYIFLFIKLFHHVLS